MKKHKGFTLIELLIVIGLIAILAGVVFVSLDPLTRFRDARNARRSADVAAITSALRVNQVDNGGAYLDSVNDLAADGTKSYLIGNCTAGADATCPLTDTVYTTQPSCIDLSGLAGYLPIPVSPKIETEWSADQTGYYLVRKASGAITVGACDLEGATRIETTR